MVNEHALEIKVDSEKLPLGKEPKEIHETSSLSCYQND